MSRVSHDTDDSVTAMSRANHKTEDAVGGMFGATRESCRVCPTHIACNRLDLVMTDDPDIVDVVVGEVPTVHFRSLLCQLCASCAKYNVRSTKASYQLGQCQQCSQEHYLEHHFEVC